MRLLQAAILLAATVSGALAPAPGLAQAQGGQQTGYGRPATVQPRAIAPRGGLSLTLGAAAVAGLAAAAAIGIAAATSSSDDSSGTAAGSSDTSSATTTQF